MNIENSRNYYGQVLQGSADLRTDACSTADAPGPELRAALARIHPDVTGRYYGCGFIAPADITGLRILDLGCGAGQDVYALAQFVGADGHVTGVDATPEQLAVARATQGWHRDRFGFANVDFVDGDIEQLDALGLEPECEDYGQAVVDRGTVPGHPGRFVLDKHHVIETGNVFPVCGNSWKMLHDTRFARHFDFIGDFSRHFGIFAGCGTSLPFDTVAAGAVASSGCC